MALESLGKLLIYIGIIIVLMGGFFLFLSKMPWFGRLPGDISINRGSWTILVPITTSVIVSVVLTLILNLILRNK